MQDLLFLVPLLPLASSLVLLLTAGRLSPWAVAILGVGSLGLAALLTLAIGWSFIASGEPVFVQLIFAWLPIAGAPLDFALQLDQLSLVMMGVITGVGWMIHWYGAAYMYGDKDVQRFFVYMNLFVFAMLILVLADNLVVLYLGWEGVGLCSFLLIGFWQHQPGNVKAAKKAFIVTRVGDTAMMIGLVILFSEFGTLQISAINDASASGSTDTLWLACLLLVGGAVGKSAQLPLQTWLPDAMAGPTPVSALIHAATMVTAGVYLIARMHPLFLQVTEILTLVAWIGALTLVLAGLAALAQTDIKRILAYSTMSQIGYMFLGLGALAFDGAIFHLMTHAFFKALLFLTAGSIIVKMHHQQDIFKMGGLFRSLPVTSTFLLIGLLALVAFPGTAGFFSKEAILAATWQSNTAGANLWWLGVLGAFLTSLYSFRLLFIVCFGPAWQGPAREGPASQDPTDHAQPLEDFRPSNHLVLPLLPLAVLALVGGFVNLNFDQVFNSTNPAHPPLWIEWMPVLVSVLGFALAWGLFFPRTVAQANSSRLSRFCRNGLGFDWLYAQLFTRPLHWFARVNKTDVIDHFYHFVGWFNFSLNEVLVISQNGKVRWYLYGTLVGCALMLGGLVWWH